MQKFVINPPVFYGAVAIIGAVLAVGVIAPDSTETALKTLQSWILDRFGWLYIISVGVFVITAAAFALGRTGALKLGPDDSEPDFNYATWISMLFAAGMGIGLMFFAVGEPMTHFAAPPEADPGTIAAQREAMLVTFFHWGVHAWAIYAIVGLSLAYFGYRYNLPLTVRSGLYPLLKDRIYGPWGHAVDIFSICGTLFGIATSLGLGVLQINSGLNYLIGIPVSAWVQVLLIACITCVATLSTVSGVDKGIRRLSELNLLLALLLMVFVLAVGPTAYLLNALVQNIGLYLDNFVSRTFNIYAYEPRPWIDNWTLFYWAWWISWSPFVGMFIARISRGRTVREFTVGVLLIPVGFTFMWMTVFGNTAMFLDTTVANGALSQDVARDISVALFQFFEYLPFSAVTSTLAVMLVAVFFVTSSDSGSLVVDTISSGGRETPVPQRVFWCTMEGAVAAVLLLAGGLSALQTAAIASALPFTFVMLILCVGLFRGMRSDLAIKETAAMPAPAYAAVDLSWRKRLERVLTTPDKEHITKFLSGTVLPALREVVAEFEKRGMTAQVEQDKEAGAVSLVVPSEGPRNFVYGARLGSHRLPAFDMREVVDSTSGRMIGYEARTFFSDGSRGYDIMGLTREQIIADVLTQFERYWAIVHSQPSQLYVTSPDAA